jgi:hypothetical protein
MLFSSWNEHFTSAPLLQLPDFENNFIIECDASESGFGAVLHQGNGPIAFFSRAVAPHHAKLLAYERELIGLVKAVWHWRPYVWRRFFIVRTYHFSLKFILNQHLTTIPQHTWVSKLFSYDFRVEYRQGKLNVVADALLRRGEEAMESHALSGSTFEAYETLHTELLDRPKAVQLREQLHAWTAPNGWTAVDGILLFQGRAFLPDDSSLWQQVLDHAHTMGHEGSEKTLHWLHTAFYSPTTRCKVHDYVRSCLISQKNKTYHLHPARLLQPLPIPNQVWSNIVMDFIEGCPKVRGKYVILTVVDRFSKFAHFIQLSHPYSASSVAKAFFDNIVHLHGLPCSIVSDQDPVFTSGFWKELFHLTGVKLLLSSAFHPQTDGQLDVMNWMIAMYLRCLAGDRPRSWLQWLPWAKFCYNSSYHMALKTTPFKVVYDRDPPTLLKY